MSLSKHDDSKTKIRVAIIAGIFAILAACVGLGAPLIERFLQNVDQASQSDSPTATPETMVTASAPSLSVTATSLPTDIPTATDIQTPTLIPTNTPLPTSTFTPRPTFTPTPPPTPLPTSTPSSNIWLFSDSSWRVLAEEIPGWNAQGLDDSWWFAAEELDFGDPARIINMGSRAKWMWYPDGQDYIDVPFFFRREVELSSNPSVASITISANDDYYLYVNGVFVGSEKDVWHGWEAAETYDVALYLVAGENVIAIKAINTQQEGWLLVKAYIEY